MTPIEIDAALRIREVDRSIRKLNQDIHASRISPLNIPTLLDARGFERELSGLRRQALQSAITVPVKAKLDIPDNVAIAVKFDSASQNLTKNITDAISAGFKQATSGNIFTGLFKGVTGIGTALFGGIASTLGSLISGAVIGLTLPLGQKLGKGLAEGVESELRDVIGSFDLVGRSIGLGLTDEILTSLGSDLKSMRSVFESFIPSLQITTESAAGRNDAQERDRNRIKSAERQFAAEQQRLKQQERLFRAKEQALNDTNDKITALSAKITQKIADFETSAGLPALVASFQAGINKLNERSALLQQKLAVPESLRSDRDERAIELLNKQIKDASRDIKNAQTGIQAIDRSVSEQFGAELDSLSSLVARYNKALNKFETEVGRIDEVIASVQIRKDANRGKLVDFELSSAPASSFSATQQSSSEIPQNIQPFNELVELYENIEQAETELKNKNTKNRRLADKKEEFQLEVDLIRQQEARIKLLDSLIKSQDVVETASPDRFRELAKIIFELSNIDPGAGKTKLPELVLPGGNLLEQLLTTDTLAAFSEQLNSLVVDPNLFLAFTEQLELTNREVVEGVGLSIRELRKQITSNLNGKNLKELSTADLPDTLLQPTPEESELIGEQVARLFSSAGNAGIDPKVAASIEQDALLFELRYTEAIAKRIGLLTTDFNIDNFNEGITAQITRDANQSLQAIFQTLAAASGLSFDAIADSISSVVLPETERLRSLIASHATARFDALSNQILLRPATFNELAKGGINLNNLETETIAHEIRHAFQTAFGKLTPEELNAGQFGVELLKATKEEMKLIGADIEKSVASALKNGSAYSEETIRALEEDAYVFQLRAGKLVRSAIEQTVNKNSIPKNLNNLQSSVSAPSDLEDSIKQQVTDAQNAYQIIFEEVIKASDLGDELELLIASIPDLKAISLQRLAENPDLKGAYDRLFNQIQLKDEDIKALEANIVDFDLVSFLAHELRHSLEQMFGSISDAEFKGGESGVELLKATAEEFSQFGDALVTSVSNADPDRQDIAQILEEDAYTFQLRFAESIYKAVRSRLESVNQQIQVNESANPKNESIKEAVENVENNITNAQKIYEQIFRLVAEASNFTLYDFDRPPELEPKSLPNGIKGQYKADSNKVSLSPKSFEDLNFNLITKEVVDILVHEIRHAFQSELGKLDVADKLAGQFGVDLIEPTIEELAQISEQVNKSVAQTLLSLKNAGVSDKAIADIAPLLKQTETDAYTFSLRLHEKIFNSLLSSLRPELIDIGDLTALSQEEIINLFNSEQFSSSGLKELVKRIGVSASVYQSATKEELATVLANQTERGRGDEIRTVANSLGDRLKNQKYQSFATPKLPTIDEQAYIKRLQDASANINEIISLLQSNPPQTLLQLNQHLKNLAKQIIARKDEINQITSINDLSSETAQIIAGYKSRFQELALNIINAIALSKNQTVEVGLSQLAELERELVRATSDTQARSEDALLAPKAQNGRLAVRPQVRTLGSGLPTPLSSVAHPRPLLATKPDKLLSRPAREQIFSKEQIDAEVNKENVTKSTLKEAIADYKNAIIKYRQELEQKILDDTAVAADFEAGRELAQTGQALATALKEQGGFSKEARSLSRVSQTLLRKTDAIDIASSPVGEEVINGILEGIESKLAVVFLQGETLGLELLKGFKQALDIKSPSGEFERAMDEVAAGGEKGASNNSDRFSQIGQDFAGDITDNFTPQLILPAAPQVPLLPPATDVAAYDFWDDDRSRDAEKYVEGLADKNETVLDSFAKTKEQIDDLDAALTRLDETTQTAAFPTPLLPPATDVAAYDFWDDDRLRDAEKYVEGLAASDNNSLIDSIGRVDVAINSLDAALTRLDELSVIDTDFIADPDVEGITKDIDANINDRRTLDQLIDSIPVEDEIESIYNGLELDDPWIDLKDAIYDVDNSIADLNNSVAATPELTVDDDPWIDLNDAIDDVVNSIKRTTEISPEPSQIDEIPNAYVTPENITSSLTPDPWEDAQEQISQVGIKLEDLAGQVEEFLDPWEDSSPELLGVHDINGHLPLRPSGVAERGLEIRQDSIPSPDLETTETHSSGFFDRLKQRITDVRSAWNNLFTNNTDTDSQFDEAVATAEIVTANIEANLAVVDQAVENSERQLEESNDAVSESVNNLGNETETISSKIKRLVKIGLKEFNNLEGATKRVTGAFKFLAAGIIAVKAVEFLQDKFSQFTETLEETIMRFDDLKKGLLFVNDRDVEKTESQLKFLRSEADRLKVSFLDAAEGFKAVAGAARDTELEGLSKQIYTSVSQAARVLQLDGETVKGTFKALNDIIGKGVVQAEEIRGQLGDRIPGAMQIAARAMGTTTQELSKLIETGQVTSEEFIPKFIAQLEAETRSGLADSTKSLSASIVDLENKIVDLQLAVGEALGFAENKTKAISVAVLALDALSLTIKVAAESIPALVLAAKGLIGLGLIKFLQMAAFQFFALGNSLKTLALNFNAGAASSMKLKRALVQLRRIARTLKTLFKGFIVVEALTVAIDTFNRLKNGIAEAKDGLDEIKQSYLDFQKAIVENNPENELLIEDIVKQNIEAIKENRNWYMKLADASKKFLSSEESGFLSAERQKRQASKRRNSLFGLTYDEAQINQASNRLTESIAEADANLSNLNIDIGVNLSEVETDNIREAIALVNRTIAGLKTQTATTVAEQEDLNAAIATQKERAEALRKELEKRFNLEKSLAKIILNRNRVSDAATEAEAEAIANIDKETLLSGDLHRDVELLKLQLSQQRIETQYDNELRTYEQFSAEITRRNQKQFNNEKVDLDKQKEQKLITEKSYQDALSSLKEKYQDLDPDTGLPKNLTDEEIKQYQELRDGVRAIRTEMMENSLAIAQAEIDERLRIYDEHFEKLEDKRLAAENKAIEAEKERLIEIQQLVNDDLIDTPLAEQLKTNLTRDRISSELKQEKEKLRQLKRFKSSEVEVQEKRDEDIKASRTKVLDLTLQLLEQEKQAEEKTIEAIALLRDAAYSVLESNLNRLQSLYQTEAQLISDRASADEKLADLELAKLRQAVELRKQINSGELNVSERRIALRQLHSLGVKGRTNELSLLEKIADREEKLAKDKLKNLEIQQAYARQQLEIENQQLIIATNRAKIEADRNLINAEKEVNSASSAIALAEDKVINAKTDEELKAANVELDNANKLYNLAQESLDLANKDVDLSRHQLGLLDSTIAKKEENLRLTQAIALAEAKGTSSDEKFDRERAELEARERRDRRSFSAGEKIDLSKYESDRLEIDRLVSDRKKKLGDKFSEEDEAKYRTQLQQGAIKLNARSDRNIYRELRGNNGFTIEAPPEVLDAIRSGKGFKVPVVPQSKQPLELDVLGKTSGSLSQDNMILKTLQNIEQKFKQPTVVNNDNQFINQYQRNDLDEILRQTRSDLVDIVNLAAKEL